VIALVGVSEAVTAAVVAAVPDAEVRTLDAAPEAARLLGRGGVDALVLDRDAVGRADPLLDDVREGAFGDPRLPLVLWTDDPLPAGFPLLAYDALLDGDASPEAVGSAVADVTRVAAYREAIDDLYEQCRDRATGEVGGPALADLGPVRDAADRALSDLDPATLADLLWAPGDRPAREYLRADAGGERGNGRRGRESGNGSEGGDRCEFEGESK
jgi:hypothetical protein